LQTLFAEFEQLRASQRRRIGRRDDAEIASYFDR
jgi:hypothetical protein